jgi:hypothetical protein
MVALGESGRIAVALGGGGPRSAQRLSLVNSQGFVYEAAMDCAGKSFTRYSSGLSLIESGAADGTGNWIFAAPSNGAGAATQLMSYEANKPLARCAESDELDNSFSVPTAQASNGEVLGIYSSAMSTPFYQGRWEYARSILTNSPGEWKLISSNTTFISGSPSWIAIFNDTVWRYSSASTGPAAVDSQSRVYVANAKDGRFQLQRRAWSGGTPKESNILFDEAPVGSPLLGEPVSGKPADTEVYVVTVGGKVRAFHAESLELLWEEALDISISREAQPVLVGNTLWVAGEEGQVRGVRVGSNGLNRDAQWPKAFRDNCNTSSKLVTKDNMPSCFK